MDEFVSIITRIQVPNHLACARATQFVELSSHVTAPELFSGRNPLHPLRSAIFRARALQCALLTLRMILAARVEFLLSRVAYPPHLVLRCPALTQFLPPLPGSRCARGHDQGGMPGKSSLLPLQKANTNKPHFRRNLYQECVVLYSSMRPLRAARYCPTALRYGAATVLTRGCCYRMSGTALRQDDVVMAELDSALDTVLAFLEEFVSATSMLADDSRCA